MKAELLKLSLFTAVTATLTGLLALTIANSTGGDLAYSARFTDVTGLNVGDEVRMAGVRLGSVTDIAVVDGTQASVEFEVDGATPLPASVTAAVRWRNLVGQRYLALSLGEGDARQRLPRGSELPLSRTRPALNLTVLFNGFRPLFQALDAEQVNELAGQIIQVFQGEGGTVESILGHTASLTSAIAAKDSVIGEVVTNLNTVLDTVNGRTGELTGLVDELQRLASGLAAQRQPLGSAIAALGELTDVTAGLLTSARPPLKADIAALGQVAGNLGDREDLLVGFLDHFPTKVRSIARVASYGGWFNFFACRVSGRVGVSSLGVTVDLPVLPLAGTSMPERCRS
ncbi:phospholipid/cholesterol/gamma-HCH transport system substrate-binding protein [Crossiella equi]|uniref:Phospholipid/cholesterol/gamma-HCH transport system substrate-binding protein n=1 Tax=Crossiella equi TaxID=130796 RepID=A0ABS5A9T0_9PSEU|nr:MCE family protein [Crossiella equi]MBP2473046.1 phospholipid/cholesterol/gamma-HCH transport system substrate-binding protein [Crossiella equi]